MKKVLLKTLSWLLLYIVFVVALIFTKELTCDEIWMYGFASNISKGMVPYRDFNIVVTPLYPFILSIPLLIWNNMLMVYLTQALLLTEMYYILYQMINKKIIVLLLLPFIFISFFLTPQYNVLSLFLLFAIIYSESKNNDKTTGLLLGLSILTKQTIGVFLTIASIIINRNNKDKLKKIIIWELFPILLFIFYLLITNSLIPFLDYCLFGLFDFAGSNKEKSLFTIIVFILILIHTIYLIIKKDNKYLYYLSFYVVAIPILDLTHLQLVVFAYITLLLSITKKKIILPVIIALILSSIYSQTLLLSRIENKIFPNNIKHFEYKIMNSVAQDRTNAIINYMNNNKDKKIIMLDYSAYYYKLILDKKIDFLDLTLTGNNGYHGSDKIIKRIKEQDKENTYYFIDNTEDKESSSVQYDFKVIDYIKENGQVIDYLNNYSIYKIK